MSIKDILGKLMEDNEAQVIEQGMWYRPEFRAMTEEMDARSPVGRHHRSDTTVAQIIENLRLSVMAVTEVAVRQRRKPTL